VYNIQLIIMVCLAVALHTVYFIFGIMYILFDGWFYTNRLLSLVGLLLLCK